MIKSFFFKKVEGPRYTWFFVRDWVKRVGIAKLFNIQSFAEVRER